MILGFALEDIVRVVLLPVLFVFLNSLAEVIVAISRGVERQNRSLRVLYRDSKNREQEVTTDPSSLLGLRDDFGATAIISVEKLATLNWYDYPSVSLNLCFTALASSGAALFSPGRRQIVDQFGWVFVSGVTVLVVVLILSAISRYFEGHRSAGVLAGFSLLLSLTASLFSFAMLWKALV